MVIREIRLILFGVVALGLSGCFQESPYDSLSSSKISSEYDYNFWVKESDNNTQLWTQAKAYCNPPVDITDKPNCATIRKVQLFHSNINTHKSVAYKDKGIGLMPTISPK